MYQFDSSKHSFSEYSYAIIRIVGTTLLAYIILAFLVFGLRHPYMTELEYYYYTKEALTFKHVYYDKHIEWRRGK